MESKFAIFAASAAALCLQATAFAQDDEKEERIAEMQDEIDLLTKERDLLTSQKSLLEAEKNLLKSEKELSDAKVQALGLPTFENTTTLGTNGGKMEIGLLGAEAVRAAADVIAERINAVSKDGNRPVILLAASEKQPWDDALTVKALVEFRANELATAMETWKNGSSKEVLGLDGGASLVTAAITAAAKLFGQETTVTGVELNASDEFIMRALAGKIDRARRPNALLYVAPDNPLLTSFGKLQQNIRTASGFEAPKKPNETEKRNWKILQESLDASNKLSSALTTAKSDGTIPLFIAARYSKLLDGGALIARVHSDLAQGSSVNTKNLWTFLGADPLRVSGGLIASYTLTDPTTGDIKSADIVPCRTTFTSLKKVQSDTWRIANGQKLCLEESDRATR